MKIHAALMNDQPIAQNFTMYLFTFVSPVLEISSDEAP
jgi:hypothetical protein